MCPRLSRKTYLNLAKTEDNYEVARQILTERYRNERLIVKNLLAKVVDTRPVKEENANHLRILHSIFNETAQSLQALTRQIDNDILHYLLKTKMDGESQKAWELHNPGSLCLEFEKLLKFLDNRVKSLESIRPSTSKPARENDKQILVTDRKSKHPKQKPCKFESCGENHELYFCEKFKAADVSTRREFVKNSGHCFNCLRYGHPCADCKTTLTCKECKGKHHTLLHLNQTTPVLACARTTSEGENEITFLPTAIVPVIDSKGNEIMLRALIDNCARTNAITSEACEKLKLPIKKTTEQITGLNQSEPMILHGEAEI